MEKQIVVRGKKYNYVWGDEFEENSISYAPPSEKVTAPYKWKTTGMMPIYRDLNVPSNVEDLKRFNYIKDGKLTLKAGAYDWSKYVGQKSHIGHTITQEHKYANGGVLSTCDTMVFRKGYAELRAKIPFHNGVWTAWWTRSTESDIIYYKEYGTDQHDHNFSLEIDIFETWAYLAPIVWPCIHKWYMDRFVSDGTTDFKGCGRVFDRDGKDITDEINGHKNVTYKSNGEAQFFTCGIGDGFIKDANDRNYYLPEPDKWHTYGFLWTDEEMTFSIDGEEYFTFKFCDFDGYHDDKYGYNQYMYFLLDCKLMTPSAGYGGPPEQRYGGTGDNSPVAFEVEYLRLYQEEGKEDIIIK